MTLESGDTRCSDRRGDRAARADASHRGVDRASHYGDHAGGGLARTLAGESALERDVRTGIASDSRACETSSPIVESPTKPPRTPASRFLPEPCFVAEAFTGMPDGVTSKLAVSGRFFEVGNNRASVLADSVTGVVGTASGEQTSAPQALRPQRICTVSSTARRSCVTPFCGPEWAVSAHDSYVR